MRGGEVFKSRLYEEAKFLKQYWHTHGVTVRISAFIIKVMEYKVK